jgi:membrane associated rhomboid family serine protease
VIFAALAILAAIVTASADLSSLASLDRERVLSGEIWRVFSGHMTHLTWRQYALNVPAFVIFSLLYSKRVGLGAAVSLLLFSSIVVSVVVIATGLHQVYGGLSGLSCAAISAIFLASIVENPRHLTPYILALAFSVYLIFMQGIVGGVNVAREAHIGGAISGVVFGLALHCLRKYTNTLALNKGLQNK